MKPPQQIEFVSWKPAQLGLQQLSAAMRDATNQEVS
jgi:hypothetical protein